MKRKVTAICSVVLALICVFSLSACFGGNGEFGMFTVAGKKLTSLKSTDIDFISAKKITDGYKTSSTKAVNARIVPANSYGTEDGQSFALSEEDIAMFQSIYKGIGITSYFWAVNEKNGLEIYESYLEVISTNFETVLRNNSVRLNEAIRIPNVVGCTDMLAWCEDRNADLKAREDYNRAPFLNLYTYHKTTESGTELFVLGTHAFSEISSESLFGGATCQYIQENESKFDAEGKIVKFQSSLGISLNDTRGTQKIGTNFEVSFEWIVKE